MDSLRFFVRGGGPAWFRWTVRLTLLTAITVAGFLPYSYELGGDCRLVPVAEHGVRALIADEIAAVHVTVGQVVAADYVLATLAARDEEYKVELSRAELQRAQADLDLLRAGSRAEDVRTAELKQELFQVQLDFKAMDLARVQKLRETNTTTAEELERSQKSRDHAAQLLASAQEQLTKVKNGPRPEEMRAAEANLAAKQANYKHAERMFALRQIRTPIAGRIATLHLKGRQGQVAAVGDLIAIVQDTSSLLVEIQAQEATAAYLKPGMVTKVRLNGTYGELLTGKVASIGDFAASRTVLTTSPARTDREELQEITKRTGNEPHFVPVIVELDAVRDGHAPLTPLVPGMTGYARIVVKEDHFWNVVKNPIWRFFKVDVWSWLP
jgi:putative peptide zinc metalloprotease protein